MEAVGGSGTYYYVTSSGLGCAKKGMFVA